MEKILGYDTFYDFSYIAIMYYADRKFDGIYVKKQTEISVILVCFYIMFIINIMDWQYVF